MAGHDQARKRSRGVRPGREPQYAERNHDAQRQPQDEFDFERIHADQQPLLPCVLHAGGAGYQVNTGKRGGKDLIRGVATARQPRRIGPREPLAQTVEHLTFNQGVVGSSPTRLTTFLQGFLRSLVFHVTYPRHLFACF